MPVCEYLRQRSCPMRLAVLEMKRAKLRFRPAHGRGGVADLHSCCSEHVVRCLVSSLVSALNGLAADGWCIPDTARNNIAASRLSQIHRPTGGSSGPGSTAGASEPLRPTPSLAPSQPRDHRSSASPRKARRPHRPIVGAPARGAGEAAVDGSGIAVGDTITLQPTGQQLKVVGLMRARN